MIKKKSAEYTATVIDGVLTVERNYEVELQVTKVGLEGTTVKTVGREEADSSEKRLLAGLNRMPLFCATYQGDGEWSCDISAGFQRCRAYQTGKAVGNALRKCGFGNKDIAQILRAARQVVGEWCPRQW